MPNSLLPVNYQNEILNARMGNRRQYEIIENNNGTISFIDVTEYDREGSIFDADDINDICTAINLNITNIAALEQAIPLDPVTGVKGSAESEYRTGNINITATNVGAYTKAEIDSLIAGIGGMHFEVVDSLPTQDISTTAIYLVPSSSSRYKNRKDEYVYIPANAFNPLGNEAQLVSDYSSLPATGQADVYYITSDDEKVYIYESGSYTEATNSPAHFVSTLPSQGVELDIYVLTTNNSVYQYKQEAGWEQIGSTSVDLSNYYTKTEIDTGALISTSEFGNLT